MMRGKRTMALASRTKRLAFLVFVGQELKDWGCSWQGAQSPEAAGKQFKHWLHKYKPDRVVFEHIKSAKRKGPRQQLILKELHKVARNRRISFHRVERQKTFSNLYQEAFELGARFPVLKHLVPNKPRIWQAEAANLVYFEALDLAAPVIDTKL